MEEEKVLLDEEITVLDEQEVMDDFDKIMAEEPSKGQHLMGDFKGFSKGLKSTLGSIGQSVDKIGIAADKIGNAADKVSKATSKIGKSVTETSKKVVASVKDEDYREIGSNLISGAAKVKDDVVAGTKKGFEVVSEKSKELVDQTKTVITSEQMQQLLDSCYEKSINGIPGVSKSVEQLANDYLSKSKSNELAAKALIKNQLVKCTTSGFLTSLGGLITLPVAVPANVASVIYVQMRMIAAVAKIGGYDPTNDQVQTLVYACMTGQAVGDVLKSAGVKVGNKLATSGIRKISGATLTKINQAVGFRLITKFGETGVVNLGKMVPVVGGVVGGGFDYVTTKVIAKNAYKTFILDDLS